MNIKQVSKYFWKAVYYLSILIAGATLISIWLKIDLEALKKVSRLTAFIGTGILFFMLILKNIGLPLKPQKRASFLIEQLKYQREQGLAAFYLIAGHSILEIAFIFPNTKQLFFELSTIALLSVFLIYMTITSYKPTQKRFKKWKISHSGIWIMIPLLYIHIYLLSNELPKYIVMGSMLGSSVIIGFVLSKTKRRSLRQITFSMFGVFLAGLSLITANSLDPLKKENRTPSKGIKEDEAKDVSLESKALYKDGTYSGISQGYKSGIKVSVTIKDGIIKNIKILDKGDTDPHSNPAFDRLPKAIVDANSTEVSVIAGSTFTSEGILNAVDSALTRASSSDASTKNTIQENTSSKVSSIYKDGTYSGSAQGYKSTIDVSVTITKDDITNVEVVSEHDTPQYAQRAVSSIPQKIMDANSVDVSVAAGATFTSEGIMNAVSVALEEAKK